MTLSDYIQTGSDKAGSLSALARLLGMNQPDLSKAKNRNGRIPLDTSIKLADFIGEDRIAVISANELATEKKPEKREFWGHVMASQNSTFTTQRMRFTE